MEEDPRMAALHNCYRPRIQQLAVYFNKFPQHWIDHDGSRISPFEFQKSGEDENRKCLASRVAGAAIVGSAKLIGPVTAPLVDPGS